jgi:sugar O-acyltransferase (sialic acid O-acetyltransferase NeuD family)
MLIIGAGGFAKEILEIVEQNGQLSNLAFYDDVNAETIKVFDRFPVLKNAVQVKEYFRERGNQFILGIGHPQIRFQMNEKFITLGGELFSCISKFSRIAQYQVSIGGGTNILDHAIISSNVAIGKGCLIYYQAVVTHDCILGDFVELSPGATILGRCHIGSFTQIGANATILPNIKIGKNVIVGAGAVVTKNVSDNVVVVGIPAHIKQKKGINK